MSNQAYRQADPHNPGHISDISEIEKRSDIRNRIANKRIQILTFMVDGRYDVWAKEWRGREGKAAINCEGGWGHDNVVKRMIRRGEVTFHRAPRSGGHRSNYSGVPKNQSYILITPKGVEAYEAWKRKQGKLV